MHGTTIVGSWFQHLDILRQTWMSHDSSTRKEIDHILTRSRDKTLFKFYRVYRTTGALKHLSTPTTPSSSQNCMLNLADHRSNSFSSGHLTQHVSRRTQSFNDSTILLSRTSSVRSVHANTLQMNFCTYQTSCSAVYTERDLQS